MNKLKILILILFCSNLFAQKKATSVQKEVEKPTEFTFSDNGLTDFVVIKCPDKKQPQLYKKTIDWVAVTYNVPSEVIKAKIENEYIRIEGYSKTMLNLTTESGVFPVDARYQIEISFKEGKYKFDVISVDYKLANWIEINLTKSKSSFEDSNDMIEKTNATFPMEISSYFNDLNSKLKKFIESKQIPSKKSDW
ncbi:MAG: DUF4468 domain-containing protein [Flavobacterium sp.]|uniref:DUF4468 domain-containing protein n=1 Tax=Flavobacterium sp. TaxID=239 RepID=UPI00326396B3